MRVIDDCVKCNDCGEEKPDCARYDFKYNQLTLCEECNEGFVGDLTLTRIRRAFV